MLSAQKPPNLKGDYCRIHIRVKCDTDFGQSVAVTGSVYALGNGSKDRVIHLATDPESHPIWYTKDPIVISRTSSKVSYRYCLIEGGVTKAFENSSSWRVFTPASYSNLDIIFEDCFSLINLESFGSSSDFDIYDKMHKLALSNRSRANSTSNLTDDNADAITESARCTQLVSERIVSRASDNWLDELEEVTKSTDRNEKPVENSAASKEKTPGKRLYLVCYHLPVRVQRVENASNPDEMFNITWAESIIAKSKSESVAHQMPTTWIGTLNLSVMNLTEEEKAILLKKLEEMNCIPLFIDNELTNAAYYGYCKTIMWPTFHNVDQLDHIHAAWNLQDDYRHSLSSYPPSLASSSSRSALGQVITPITSTPIGTPGHSRGKQMELQGSSHGSGGLVPPIVNPVKSTEVQGTNSPAEAHLRRGSGTNNSPGFRSRANSAVALAENRVLEWNVMEGDFFDAFSAVNRIFADFLLFDLHFNDGDVVWVHDYHLMLLPQMLREGIASRIQRSRSDNAPSPARRNRNSIPDSEQLNVDISIVFFLHIPFPTSQIFRTLPKAFELVNSLICADVLGFHSFDHARHFLNTSKRMLGYRSVSRPGGMLTLNLQDQDREVVVHVSHVSVEITDIDALAKETMMSIRSVHPENSAGEGAEENKSNETPEIHDENISAMIEDEKVVTDIMIMAQQIRNKYRGRKIVAGVDVGQRLSGVALKLAAFDNFLTNSSYGVDGNVVLIQRSKVGCGRPGDEEATSVDIKKMVADINDKHRIRRANAAQLRRPSRNEDRSGNGGESNSVWCDVPGNDEISQLHTAAAAAITAGHGNGNEEDSCVIDYAEVSRSSLRLKERLALWLAADVLLFTPIREGLNLMPLEYIYVRRSLPHAGAVVVSEFSTCASLLNGAIKINPFAPGMVADSIEKALAMSTRESDYRRQRDMNFIISHPAAQWTKTIIADLYQLRSNSGRARTNPFQYPKQLDWAALLDCYETAGIKHGICETGSRVLIFDYGGTLLHKEKNDIYMKRQVLSAISDRKPSESILRNIELLSNDPLNIVMVVTGLTQLKLGDTFMNMPNVTLATSNGLVYSWGRNLQESIRQRATQERKSLKLAKDGVRLARVYSSRSEDSASVDGKSISPPLPTSGGGKPPPIPKSSSKSLHAGMKSSGMLENIGERKWDHMTFPHLNWESVIEVAAPIIQKFTFRTNGTCTTPRWPGIGWSYFGADPDWGNVQAAQLKLELEASLAKMDVQVTSLIQGSIEVVPKSLNKGVMVSKLLSRVQAMRGGRLPGFLLVVGDEESDDKMTEAAQKTLSQAGPHADLSRCKTFTVTVGKRVCPSRYYISDVDDVDDLLQMLSNSATTRPPELEMVEHIETQLSL